MLDFKKLFLVLTLLFISCSENRLNKKAPLAKDGLLNLTDWDFKKNGSVNLDGEWKFFWKKLLDESDFKSNLEILSKDNGNFKMPNLWNQFPDPEDPSKNLDANGYASFVLRIKYSPKKNQDLAIQIIRIFSSYELFIVSNGSLRKILARGKVANDLDQYSPEIQSMTSMPLSQFQSGNSNEMILLLRVANFLHSKGNTLAPIRMGEHKELTRSFFAKRMIAAALIGLLLIMGLYHSGLFLQRKQDKASLFFALTCFSIAVRQIIMEKFLFYFLDDTGRSFFEWHSKIEFLSMYLSALFFLGFIYFLSPQIWFKKILQVFFIVTMIFTALTLLSSIKFYGAEMLSTYQIILLFFIIFVIFHLVNQSRKKDRAALYSLLGFLPFLLTVVNDILFDRAIINSTYLFPYGFALFIFAQSYTLSKIFTDAYKKAEDLTENLQFRVEERTKALAQKTEEAVREKINAEKASHALAVQTEEAIAQKNKAEKASKDLAIANEKLEKIDRQKTAFFQNITHEFRTPLNLITGPLEAELLLRRDQDRETLKEQNKQVLNNAKRLLRLINQLLDLSKSDAGRLKLEVRKGDLTEFLKVMFFSFDELAKTKKIKLNFIAAPKATEAYFDKEKVEKVIINLLSNAFKFTPENGEIDLKLTERTKTETGAENFDRHLLLVDDEEKVADNIFSQILQMKIRDFKVEYAENPQKARELLKNYSFMLIISDFKMPNEDGISFLKYCYENYPQSQRILFTSHDDKETVKKAVNEAKVHNFLSKPWKNEDLQSLLKPAFIDKKERKWIDIEIRDSGIGMKKEDLPFIFDRFSQADSADRITQAGTGIGLSLVKELITLHRGQIDVESSIGEGTRFRITLPAAKIQYDKSEIIEFYQGEERRKSGSNGSAEFGAENRQEERRKNYNADIEIAGIEHAQRKKEKKKRKFQEGRPLIYLVEDNVSMRDYICTVLEDFFNLEESGDGIEAIRLLEKKTPDLIISDINMPNMDGEELLARLKEHKTWSKIPFIHLTAKGSEDQKLSGLEAGADDYLAKPFNPKELVMRVKNLLRLKAMEKELTENVLKKYLAPDLVDQIITGDIDFLSEPKKMDITILFSDLSGFTKLSAKSSEKVISRILNDYLTSMNKVIFSNGGTIDKFMGDGIMVLFGAPIEKARLKQIEAAKNCAFSMNEELKKLNQIWIKENLIIEEDRLRMRIGIHSGPSLVGNFGSEMRSDFTAIGNNVNLAARIEGACEPDDIFCSRSVIEVLDESQFSNKGWFELKGLKDKTELFSLKSTDSIKQLLIVDDDEDVLFSLKTMISHEYPAWSITLCNNAAEAREALLKNKYICIISDDKMPKEDGISLLNFVQKEHPKTKRILLTGYADKDNLKDATNKGKLDFLFYKPWNQAELLRTLSKIIHG